MDKMGSPSLSRPASTIGGALSEAAGPLGWDRPSCWPTCCLLGRPTALQGKLTGERTGWAWDFCPCRRAGPTACHPGLAQERLSKNFRDQGPVPV